MRPIALRRAARIGIGLAILLLITLGLINLRWNFGWRFPSSQAGIDVRYGFLEVGWPRDIPTVAFSTRRSSPCLPLLPHIDIARQGDGTLSKLQYHQLAVPVWTLLAALMALLVWLRSPRRSADGVCAGCGYDMTGLPGAVVCPECGRETEDTGS